MWRGRRGGEKGCPGPMKNVGCLWARAEFRLPSDINAVLLKGLRRERFGLRLGSGPLGKYADRPQRCRETAG